MNKQQKQLKKTGMKSINGGASTQIAPIQHGKFAFQPPDAAIRRLKDNGSKSWKITKRHPAHGK